MDEGYKRILVPVDGSQSAERAFEKAIIIAQENDAHLDLLNVIDTRQFMGDMQDSLIGGDTIYQLTQDADNYLKNLIEFAEKTNNFTNIDVHIRYGNPKRVISIDFVKDHKIDLTIIGSTGLNAVERLVMGSVTEYVNQHSLADVLIVRTDLDNKKIKRK